MEDTRLRLAAVTFDAYGTLLDVETSGVGLVAETLRLEPDAAATFLASWRRHRFLEICMDACRGQVRTKLSTLTSRALDRALREHKIEAVDTARAELFEVWFAQVFYEGAVDALATLSSRVPVAIVTNMDRSDLDRLAAKLPPRIMTISTEEVGIHKPAPVSLRYACERLGFPSERVLHVAAAESEGLAAASANMPFALLQRGRTAIAALDPPTFSIRSLDEILPIVDQSWPADLRSPQSRMNVSTRVEAVNVREFEMLARHRISSAAYHYIAGGSADEITLGRNMSAFDTLEIHPRVLVDVSGVDTSQTILGTVRPHPILLAPTAYQRLLHPSGELETARGAAMAQVPFTVSTFSTTSLEAIATIPDVELWFQLYVQPDRSFTRDLIQEAEALGYKALVLTVDLPCPGVRDRDKRERFALPAGLAAAPLAKLGESAVGGEHRRRGGIFTAILDPSMTWSTAEWLVAQTKLPVIFKGILSPKDAAIAAESGATAIVVSNHGARNLDTVPATIRALPRVVRAVAGKKPIFVDGGIRRGTDILKALAFGADAVMIGRPYLWGLAAEGAEGVSKVVNMLQHELRAAMALAGVSKISEIDRDVLWTDDD